ncbi:hypothetical protein BH10PLA1_BH10PLA1_04860 [soil metagenome]
MQKLNVGIIGFGRIGAEHAAWMAQSQSVRVVEVFDATPARRDLAASRGFATTESLDLFLTSPAIEAVLISVPTSMHFDLAMQCLKAGKHVMIEKPMTLDLPQAKLIAEEAKALGKVVSVFHNRRWDADFLTVQQAIAAGTFGRVFNVESRLGQWSSCVGPAATEYRPGWRNEGSFGGGGLYDWGSHFVDQLWRLMLPAKPVHVFAQLRGNVWSSDCDDFARMLINFDNDTVGLCEINTTTTRPLPRWHIDGTEGSAFSPYSLEFDTSFWASLRFTGKSQQSHVTLPLAPAGLSEVKIWEQFAAAVHGEGSPAVSVASVLPTMCLLDAARLSSLSGKAVTVANDVEWVL